MRREIDFPCPRAVPEEHIPFQQTMADQPETESPTLQHIVSKSVHDMRTPLSCMHTALEILRLTSGDPARLEMAIGLMDNQIKELNSQLDKLSKSAREFRA